MANQMGMVFSRPDCKPRWRERLPEIEVPTLVVHGRRNRFFPVGNGEAIAREAHRRRSGLIPAPRPRARPRHLYRRRDREAGRGVPPHRLAAGTDRRRDVPRNRPVRCGTARSEARDAASAGCPQRHASGRRASSSTARWLFHQSPGSLTAAEEAPEAHTGDASEPPAHFPPWAVGSDLAWLTVGGPAIRSGHER